MTEQPIDQGTNPPIRFLRLPEVQARMGLSRSTIYVRLDQGHFPRPVSLAPVQLSLQERCRNTAQSAGIRRRSALGESTLTHQVGGRVVQESGAAARIAWCGRLDSRAVAGADGRTTHRGGRMDVTAMEVLILDTCTFVAEVGLTSRRGSALKHYLSRRGIQLVVPELVAEECERHLTQRAQGKRKRIEGELQWLGRFCGEVNGWQGPSDKTIQERARELARAEHLNAVIVRETLGVRRRAELRHRAERPPSHKGSELSDCRIWEQCLELLARCDVVFVSRDSDFRGHRRKDGLHPALRAEAEAVAEDRILTFHRTVESLLSELKSEIRPIPDDVVFAFVYESLAPVVEELKSNSGCRPQEVGEVKQTLLTTDQAEVLEVRLEIADSWQSADEANTLPFHLSASCHYRLTDETLCDLSASNVKLLTHQPDGSVRAVKGSYMSLGGHAYAGAPPIRPEPEELGTWVSTD